MASQTLASEARARTSRCPSSLFLSIREGLYRLRSLECDPETAHRAFRLQKADGTLYDVAETRFGPRCDCPDFIFRRDGLDPLGCKHVKALVEQGLIHETCVKK